MEPVAEEHEYEEGEISDDDLACKEHGVKKSGFIAEPLDRSAPILLRTASLVDHSPILQKGASNPFSRWNGKSFGSGPLEANGRQHEWGWRAEAPPFSQQPGCFFQIAWQKGVQGISKGVMEDSSKELLGHSVEGLIRDIRVQKGAINRHNSLRENCLRADRAALDSAGSSGLLHRSSSWADRDFDLHSGRKVGRLAEGQEVDASVFLDRRKIENGNLCDEGRERFEWPKDDDETPQDRLERCLSNTGVAERITLRSTIEKVDRESSESEDKEVDKRDENEGKESLQYNLLEERPQLEVAAQVRRNDRVIGEKEEGELEEGEIEGAFPVHAIPPTIDIIDEPLHNEQENGQPKRRYPKPRGSDKSHLRFDSREKKNHEISRLRHDYNQRLAECTELVKNVTVKDAQRSFINVCRQLRSALKILREMSKHTDLPSPRITTLARQVFSGIRAAYAVRNTASGKEQEQNKDFFPRLLELAYGNCQKLFTSLQVRELENMLQTTGQCIRSAQIQKNYSKHQFEVDKDEEKDSRLAESSGNTSATTQLETESTAETITNSRSINVEDDTGRTSDISATFPLLAGPLSLFDPHSMSVERSRSSQVTIPASTIGFGGWLPLSSEHVEAHKTLAMDVNKDLSDTSLSTGFIERNPISTSGVFSSFTASDLQKIQKYESKCFGVEERKPKLGSQVINVSPKATDVQVQCKSHTWPVLDPLCAVTSYQEKFAGKSLTAYTRLPSPTPSEDEDEVRAGSDADVQHSSDNGDNADVLHQISNEPKPEPLLQDMATNDSEPTSSLVSDIPQSFTVNATSFEVTTSKETHTEVKLLPTTEKAVEGPTVSKGMMLVKGPLKSRDPRRRLMNAPLNSEVPSKEGNELLLNVDIQLFESTAVIDENCRKHKADEDMGEMICPKRQHLLTDGFEKFLHEGQLPISLVAATGGWLDDDVVVPVSGPKYIEADSLAVSKCMDLSNSSLDDNLKRERGLKLLPEEFNSSIGLNKRRKIETGQQETKDISLAESFLNVRGGLTSALNHETCSLSQPLLTSSVKPTVQTAIFETTMARDFVKLRMKARDPRRALLGSILDKKEHSSLDPSKMATIALAATGPIKDGNLPFSQAVKSGQDIGSLTVKNNREPSGGTHPEGLFSISVQNITEKIKDEREDVADKSGNSHSNTLAENTVPTLPQSRTSTPSKELPEKLDLNCSNNVKDGTDNLVCKASVNMPSVPSSIRLLSNKDLNGSTGPPPLKQECSNRWEDLEHLLEGLDEQQRHAVRQERARRIEEQNRMLSARKLCLVLDLDHTLLNSAKFTEIEEEWEGRLRANEAAERARIGKEGATRRELYRFPHMGMWTKLRPGIWNFLARASQLYELHVYTMGNKAYATEMAKLLDPTGTLFAGRVISKGDDGDLSDGDERLPKSKDLDGVLGMESAVVIIDDSVRVWPHHRHNLIVVERYMYFPCSRRQFGLPGPSLLEVGHDERESDGMLASALTVIDKIHFNFFSNKRLHEVDVRDILAAEQRRVLAGCKILFSRIFPQGESQPQLHPLWQIAKQFGAVCTTVMDEEITHVVAISLGTDKVNWGLATGKFVVRPAWLEASAILYRRANERDFPVPS